MKIKKLLSIVMALAIITTSFATNVFAGGWEGKPVYATGNIVTNDGTVTTGITDYYAESIEKGYNYFPSSLYPIDDVKRITVISDITEDVKFEVASENISLDVDETITNASNVATIINYSNLTLPSINATGTITNTADQSVLVNYGTYTQSGVQFIATNNTDYAVKNDGTMNVYITSIVGSKTLFYNQGDLTIDSYWGLADVATADAIVYNTTGGTVTINGGDYSTIPHILAEGSSTKNVTITAGNYAEDPTAYLPEGYAAVYNTVSNVDMWTVITPDVVKDVQEAIAGIQDTDFSEYPAELADEFAALVEEYTDHLNTVTNNQGIEFFLEEFYKDIEKIVVCDKLDKSLAKYNEADYEANDYYQIKNYYEDAKLKVVHSVYSTEEIKNFDVSALEAQADAIPKKEPKKTIEATTIDNSSANAQIIENELLGLLTKAEFEGTESVKIKLSVNDIQALVPTESEALETLVKNSTDDYTVAYAWDIDLTKYVGDTATALTDLNGKEITITLDVPQEVQNEKIAIVRIHDGVATVLADIDQDTTTYTFKSDLFSTYALVKVTEKSEPTATPTPTTEPTTEPSVTPAPTTESTTEPSVTPAPTTEPTTEPTVTPTPTTEPTVTPAPTTKPSPTSAPTAEPEVDVPQTGDTDTTGVIVMIMITSLVAVAWIFKKKFVK